MYFFFNFVCVACRMCWWVLVWVGNVYLVCIYFVVLFFFLAFCEVPFVFETAMLKVYKVVIQFCKASTQQLVPILVFPIFDICCDFYLKLKKLQLFSDLWKKLRSMSESRNTAIMAFCYLFWLWFYTFETRMCVLLRSHMPGWC